MDKIDRIKELVDLVNKYNYAYYTLDEPLVSDKQYDDLYYELVDLEKETGVILENSPTQKVGDVVLEKFEKVKHEKKLYSLNKANTFEEVKSWIDSMSSFGAKKFSVEYKFDGLRVIAQYSNGILKQCATRGNGIVGEDITAQVKVIKNVPKTIPFRGEITVMGEVMMKLSELNKFNKTHDEQLKNPRNAAAGALRNLDTKVTASRNLDAFMYDVLTSSRKFNSQEEMHNFLKEQGFDTFDYYKTVDNFEDICKYIANVDKTKKDLDILIDGMVFKVDDVSIRDDIGYTEKYPKWALAYKFEALEMTSKVKDVVWQVGRTGKLTPICEIEPIELAGATITRATLNNMQDIMRKDVKIGSNVFVRRSNEVIPEILGVAEHFKDSKDVIKPDVCPSCGKQLEFDEINLFCVNKECKERVVSYISHFVSKDAMNIEGLSEKTIELLYNNLNVRTLTDLYTLTYDQLESLDGFKSKKVNNLINNIEKSKNVNLENFIFALGINGVGFKTSKDIAKTFGTFNNFKNSTFIELVAIKDIGDTIAQNIIDYFGDRGNIDTINKLFELGIKVSENTSFDVVDSVFTGKTIVITGTLENMSRDVASKYLEMLGGIISSSVSSKTNYLLCCENAGSKLEKAKSLGVEIIDLNFLKNEIRKIGIADID